MDSVAVTVTAPVSSLKAYLILVAFSKAGESITYVLYTNILIVPIN
jgi:hypothetical protein